MSILYQFVFYYRMSLSLSVSYGSVFDRLLLVQVRRVDHGLLLLSISRLSLRLDPVLYPQRLITLTHSLPPHEHRQHHLSLILHIAKGLFTSSAK